MLVESGRCDVHGGPAKPWAHRPQQIDATPRLRGRANQRRREALFAREPLCRACVAHGRVTVATIRDHIAPLAEGGSETIDNEQPLCDECHTAKTAEESKRGVRRSWR